MTDQQALGVGVTWFTELVCVYGILFGLCWWGIRRVSARQRRLAERIRGLEDYSEQLMEALETVKDRQIVLRADLRVLC